MPTANLTFRDETKQVPFTLGAEQNAEAKVKVKAERFLETVGIDDILHYLAQEIIEDAYSEQEDNEPLFDKYAELYAQFEIGMINFDDDDLVVFVSAEGMDITVQLSYAGQVTD